MKSEEIKMVENLGINKDLYRIRWDVTYLCNYSCAFCIQGDHDKHIKRSEGESGKIRKRICDKIIKYIENVLNGKYKKLYINLIGGEVTILKDFPEILRKLANVKFEGDIEYFITTNLSMSTDTLKEIANIFKGNQDKKYLRMLHITASFYKEFTTEEEIVEKIKVIHNPWKAKNYLVKSQARFRKDGMMNKIIFTIIKRLDRKNHNVITEVLYPLVEDSDYDKFLTFKKKNKKYIDNVNYIVIRRFDKSISNDLKKFLKRDYKKNVRVTFSNDETKYFYRTIDFSLEVEDGFNPSGMICDAGVNSISINNLGMISRCCCCKKKTAVGNILEGDFKGVSEAIVCPNHVCTSGDYSIIKRP